ncbi:MAG: glycosyltransferase family 4 protein, partial [Candidatus Nanoarchaeia archaeon]
KDHKRQNFFLKNKLKDILKERDFDYIQVENLCTAPVLEGIKTNSKKIIDFMEICSYLKNSSKERFLIRKYERKISKVYDIAICCSEVDKKRLSELGYCNVFVVPNGVDFIHFKFTKKKPLKNKSEKSLLFVGGLYHKQNFEAVKYFFKKIYPLLNKDIQINIIGKCDKSKFIDEKGFENVNFLGFVKDIRSYFENSIFICPLLDGGGTRLKILTAFSLGSPVVSTSKGAEGIECFNGGNILLANSPEAFVKNINNLLENPTLYKKIRTNALKLVKEKYLWGSIVKNYNSFLKNITT